MDSWPDGRRVGTGAENIVVAKSGPRGSYTRGGKLSALRGIQTTIGARNGINTVSAGLARV